MPQATQNLGNWASFNLLVSNVAASSVTAGSFAFVEDQQRTVKSNGTMWIGMADDGIVNPQNYANLNASGVYDLTGTTTNDLALQAALFAASQTLTPLVHPAGTCLLSMAYGPMKLNYRLGTGIVMRGAGGPGSQNQSGGANTTFINQSLVCPTFDHTGSRGVFLRDFSVFGQNLMLTTRSLSTDLPSDWITPGCSNNSGVGPLGGMQSSPYSGISQDLFASNGTPTDGGVPGLSGIGPYSTTITSGQSQITLNNSAKLLIMGMTCKFDTTVGTGSGGVVAGTVYFITATDPGFTWIQVATTSGGYPIVFNASSGAANLTGSFYQGATGSSKTEYRNVGCQQFVVGFAHGLGPGANISDTTDYIKCIGNGDAGIAIGHSQAKIVTTYAGTLTARNPIDCTTYGLQSGYPPVVNETQLGGFRAGIFQDNVAPLRMYGVYSESLRSIITWGIGASTAKQHALLSGCDLRTSAALYGLLPPVEIVAYGNLTLDGGAVSCDTYQASANFMANVAPIQIKETNVTSTSGPIGAHVSGLQYANAILEEVMNNSGVYLTDKSPASLALYAVSGRLRTQGQPKLITNGSAAYDNPGVSMDGPSGSGVISVACSNLTIQTTSITFATAPTVGGATNTLPALTAAWTNPTGFYNTTFSTAQVVPLFYKLGSAAVVWANPYNTALALTGTPTASATVQNTSLTFTATNAALLEVGDLIFWVMLQQGDLTKWRVLAWQVVNINTGGTPGAITCLPTRDATYHDIVANQGGSSSVTLNQPQWAASQSLTCNCNNSSTITNLNALSMLLNGDWLTGGGTYFPANTRVLMGARAVIPSVISGEPTSTITLTGPTGTLNSSNPNISISTTGNLFPWGAEVETSVSYGGFTAGTPYYVVSYGVGSSSSSGSIQLSATLGGAAIQSSANSSVASASQNTSTGVWTTATQGLAAGTPVTVTNSVTPEFVTGTVYYVIAAGLSSTACELSATSGGSVIVPSNSSGAYASASQNTSTGLFATATQGFTAGLAVTITGTPSPEFSTGTKYYVLAAGLTTTACELSATPSGPAIVPSVSSACTLNVAAPTLQVAQSIIPVSLFANGQTVQLSAAVAPLTTATNYYIVNSSITAGVLTINLSLTSGGGAVTFTANGTPTLNLSSVILNQATTGGAQIGVPLNGPSELYNLAVTPPY
jgi:hypothetical protein